MIGQRLVGRIIYKLNGKDRIHAITFGDEVTVLDGFYRGQKGVVVDCSRRRYGVAIQHKPTGINVLAEVLRRHLGRSTPTVHVEEE